MNSIIEKIWSGELNPIDYSDKTNKEYKDKERSLYATVNNFEDCLNDEQRKKLQTILKHMEAFISVSEKQAFTIGFSIGVCSTSEAFIKSENFHSK